MISAILAKPKQFLLQKGKIPPLSKGDVLVKVICCGICGSDVHTFMGHNPFVELPAILGHELIGEVVEVGSQVSSVKVGNRVTYEPTNECGTCLYCIAGNYHLCINRTPTKGAFRDYVILGERQVHVVPTRIDVKTAALIEPLASALHALKVATLEKGQSILIIGAGTIGILLSLTAKLYGAEYVAITNRSSPKLETAKKLGVDETILTKTGSSNDDVIKRVGKNRIDIIFDTVVNTSTIDCGLSVVKKGGTLVVVGTPEKAIQADFGKILINELRVNGSLKYRNNFPEAIDILHQNRLDLSPLISHIFPLTEIQNAFEEISVNSANYIKCLIQP
jgi:L-iditol 2-dehydrogenase